MGEWKALKKASGTGWKELEREAGTGWKALLWKTIIDLGNPCTNEALAGAANYTYLQMINTADADGTIDEVCLYINFAGSFYIGIFYPTTGNNYKCRSAADLGALSLGLNTKTGLSLAVHSGDVIGFWSSSGKVDAKVQTVGKRYSEAAGNNCVVDNEESYSSAQNYGDSIFGKNY